MHWKQPPPLVLLEMISEFVAIDRIKYIWDIGSCDGQDSLVLSQAFPTARISSFEPNPDTFHLVKKVSEKSNGFIDAHNFALADFNGMGVFHKIDTINTKTSHKNGNPGASSMFKANGEYVIEDYVQLPVEVQFKSGHELISKSGFDVPNLLWMDVQGAEGLVLTGLGEYLREIDFIYMELTLKEIYTGQTLAKDILALIKRDFYWYQNLNLGFWQFDGLFVNKKYKTLNLVLRNLMLRSSLNLNLGIGIKLENLPIRTYLSRAVRKFYKI